MEWPAYATIKTHCALSFALGLSYLAHCQNQPLSRFEGYYMAQGPYPNYISSVDWFPDDYEIQGVTNDGENWFFTLVDQDGTTGVLWRIPKEVSLNGDVSGNPGVMNTELDETALPSSAWHWGDLDHFEYLGVDYLIVPIYSVFAIFRADDLDFVNYGNFPGSVGGGWCAVGVDLNLYASPNSGEPLVIKKFFVDWNGLLFDGVHNVLQESDEYALAKANGDDLEVTDMQGGEFSPSGEMLYLVSGRGACLEWLGIPGAEWTPNDGIHAIRTDTWRRVEQSVKNSLTTNHFSYSYDPTCIICDILGVPVGGGTDTPEGLTIWNLDDGSAPGIRGSLHVLLDRYMYGGTNCDDRVAFHHYSSKVYVDIDAVSGVNRPGTLTNQFNSVMDAHDFYPIWDGAIMSISEGVYDDTGLLNKRIKLQNRNGTVLIGQQ